MNKKLFSGLALMSVAATAFWACGEGNINGKDLNDKQIQQLREWLLSEHRPDIYAQEYNVEVINKIS